MGDLVCYSQGTVIENSVLREMFGHKMDGVTADWVVCAADQV